MSALKPGMLLGTFDAHSGIIIEGDVLSPTRQHTVDPNELSGSSWTHPPPGGNQTILQTVDVVGPHDGWVDIYSFCDEDLSLLRGPSWDCGGSPAQP